MAIQNVTDSYVLAQTAGDTYSGDASDQTYSINPNLVGAGDVITIVDQGGNNVIELPAGLQIVSSQTISNQTILTLSNGAVIDIRGADTFTFNIGQNLAGGDTVGSSLNFAEFTQNVLGVTVPAPGAPVIDGGGAVTNDDGSATVEGQGPILALTASDNSLEEGDSVIVSVTVAEANSTIDYTISGVNAADVDALTGTITTDENGEGSAMIAAIADLTTEGEETMSVSVEGADPIEIVIVDTSITPSKFELTTATDTLLPVGAELPEGVEEADVVRTSAGDDTIFGTASLLFATWTLNPADLIDGGEGSDTLDVEMLGNFTGFTSAGGMSNVENVVLTNGSNIGRTFDATGVYSVEKYTLNSADARLDLSNLSDDAIVMVNGAQDDFSISYDAEAELTDVTLELYLDSVGAHDDPDTVANERAVVAPTIGDEVRLLVVGATGDNVVHLSSAGLAEMLTILGEGTLDIEAVNAELTEIDASDNSGGVTIDGSAADELTTVGLGSGDDAFSVDTNSIRNTAVVAGGDGVDMLMLTGSGTTGRDTVVFEMTGIETVALDSDVRFAGRNASDVETIVQGTGDNQFVELGGADLTVELDKDSTGVLLVDNSGATTVNISAGPDGGTIGADVTLTESTSVEVNVGEDTTYTSIDGDNVGTISANAADSLVVNAAGALGTIDPDDFRNVVYATFNAEAASSAVFDLGDEDHRINLFAENVTDLQLTNVGGDDVGVGGTLSGVKNFFADVDGSLGVFASLESVASVEAVGAGSVNMNNLGNGALDYGIDVSATVAGDFFTGFIFTGVGQDIAVNVGGVGGVAVVQGAEVTEDGGALTGSITIDADGLVGSFGAAVNTSAPTFLSASDVTVNADTLDGVNIGGFLFNGMASVYVNGGIVADTATVTGSSLSSNDIAVNVGEFAKLTGGISNDLFVIDVTNVSGEIAMITLTGGDGEDAFNVGSATDLDGNAIITVTDFEAGDTSNFNVKFGVGTFASSDFDSDDLAIELLQDAGLAGATADADDIAFLDLNSQFFTFGGDTFFAHLRSDSPATAGFDNGEVIVRLVGVQDVDEVGEALGLTVTPLM